MSLVIAYFLFRRGGENAMWMFRKDGTDPPSFRRWQARQKRRGAGRSVTGRAEGRKFWANVWQDAHASAHEWRQRKYGRRQEDRRKRWQAEDVEREQARATAPCVFCGAGAGVDCATDCPEREAHDANRANGGSSTVPSGTDRTVPEETTGPWRTVPTVPSEPSRVRGTVPDDRATPGTEPSHHTEPTEPLHRATPDRATGPGGSPCPIPDEEPGPPDGTAGIVHDTDEYATNPERNPSPRFYRSEPGPVFNSPEELIAWADAQQPCAHCGVKGNLRGGGFDENGRYNFDICHESGCPEVPANVSGSTTDDLARKRAEKSTITGGNVTGSTATGEITGYESTLAEMDQTIAHLEAKHAQADQDLASFKQLDAVYENRIDGLRHGNADEETIGTQVAAREANETQISAAAATLEATANSLETATAARDRWVAGQGAMKETGDATGAEGDRVLRS